MTLPPDVPDKVADKTVVQLDILPAPFRDRRSRRPSPLLIPENRARLNRAAWRQLKRAGQPTPPHELHILSLAWWGLEEKVEGEWPERDRHAVEAQVALLFGWAQKNVLRWLTSHPEGPSQSEQRADLLRSIQCAADPRHAAAIVLSTIYSRLQAECPALQPAATGW